MEIHGPWKIVSSQEIYSDPWMDLRLDQVIRPDGKPGTYSTVRLKAGVCVIAVDAHKNVHLTREFHYAVGRVTLEGVSGGIEPGEDPIECARRELREELGIVADTWKELGWVDPFTSAIASPTRLYLATHLTFVPPENEGTECIERVEMSLEDALLAIDSQTITHAPTCVALLKIARLAQSQ